MTLVAAVGETPLVRMAVRDDLPAIVALITVEDSVVEPASVELNARHLRAFEAIERDPRNELLVLESHDGLVLACLQVTYIPGLGRAAAERAHLEALRVRVDHRGLGLGTLLVRHVTERARARGCALVQLTSNKQRDRAHSFYSSLGFVASHEGFKLPI